MKKKLLHIIPLWFVALACYAQEETPLPLTYQSFLIGGGTTSTYDSYLSPLKYSGMNIGLLGERMKTPRRWKGRIATQHFFNLELADTKNPSGSAQSYVGSLEYDYGLYYRLNPVRNIQLYTGLQGNLSAGVIYNLRNTNNPANAKVGANLNLSAMAIYAFQIKRQPIRLRYQMNVPVVGALFSPEFGQSYYEIGLGDESQLIYPAAWHNRLTIRNILSVEIPLKACTLRITGMNRLYQTHLNDLKTQILSNAVYVGISKYFHTVSGKQTDKNKYRYVF
ncbi:MAG: DUF3316 domain-containing protein [Dysgonamonadaceae bacterium]|jgi:hypothetical protein|nr:DUF3316 domain-containing protein [Dysgonamonadaceae bacterium]